MSYPTLQLVESGALPTAADNMPWVPEGEWHVRTLPGPEHMYGVTYRSHTIVLSWKWTPLDVPASRQGSCATGMAAFYMRMTHGGGTFLYRVCSHMIESQWGNWSSLPDEPLYSIFYEIWNALKEGVEIGETSTAEKYRRAFVEGRLLKRKRRNRASYEVWIAPPPAPEPAPQRAY